MLRILLCVPASNLDQTAEIRDITTMHIVTVLSGVVTARDLFTTCNAHRFDVLHFACHGDAHGIYLNSTQDAVTRQFVLADNPAQVTTAELAQLVRACGARLVVLNACLTSAVAVALVLHGAAYCINALHSIFDHDAWKVPLLLYKALTDIEDATIVAAYTHADDELQYDFHVAPKLLLQMFNTIDELKRMLSNDVQVKLPRSYIQIGLPLLLFLYALLVYLTWR